ncbi:TRAP-type C4-dicarboxylate transport system, small permease component [Tranquillimonas rosea]|uniref:TRAP transporter small permease protein n=1 Tax=Tranquillimonas rosea TaxID=641238 RepID=A0A1H9X661_9RHOB|nr:TRAP transporter small permease [Tranquillimonas rosea]SES41357.1 TRAP-type C4-dicarboxylate transport system, small permease component [Tranquillimonas rosea]
MAGGDELSATDRGRARRALSRALGRVLGFIDVSGRALGIACLAVMFVALLTNVVLRYLFGSGIAWAYEIHSVLLPWLVAAGIVAAAARRQHIAISILSDMLTGRGRHALAILINVVVLVIAISVLWSSQPILQASKFQRLSTLGITQIWGYASLVYAFAGLALTSALNIARASLGADILGLDLEDQSFS